MLGFIFAMALAAQTIPGVAVTGVVQDQTGAVLPGADVDLATPVGAAIQSTKTTNDGTFRFDGVGPGQYQLLARFTGFDPASLTLRVSTRPLRPQRLQLAIAGIRQEITVSSNGAQVSPGLANNVDAVAVDTHMLETLPVFDNDYIGTMSRFLDAGSLGNTGVTIVINGMEVSSLNVSASAIQQIRINQDPYSAEYSRPGRGRIEILTKPGSQSYHGDVNLTFRDSSLNAANPFATTKPPENRRIVEGFVGGPVGSSGKSWFMLSANDERKDLQAIIHASGPDGLIQGTLPQPSARSLLTGSITHQFGDRTTFSIRPAFQYEKDENRGAGGTTLPSAAWTFTHNEQQVTFTEQSVIRPTLVNQFQLLVGHEREPTVSVSPEQGLVVAGAFTGGGAQIDLLRTETHINLNESLGWTKGRHFVQAGFQLPDWSRRGFFDHSDFGGTFYFSGLETLSVDRPYSYFQQAGNGDVVFLEKQLGAYVKDDWQLRPGLSIGLGVRYDWQNYFHDDNNVAPRMSVAFAPGNGKANVLRAGIGLFNDRSGPAVIADVLHSRPGGLVRIVIPDPDFPDPFASTEAPLVPSTVRLAPDVQIPQTLQFGVGFDHQLRKTTTLSVTYTGGQGYHLFRSRDVNAPPPPLYLARPDPAYGVIRQVESTGRQRTDSLQVTLRGKVTRWFNGQTQYTLSRADNDTSGLNAFPANDYDVSTEWGPADFDRRHRFLVLGQITAVRWVNFGVGLTMNSAGPYSETLGIDVYNNGRGEARPPGVPRNSLRAAPYSSLDLRASRELKLHGAATSTRSVVVSVDAFNVLNHVNYSSFVGTVGSDLFRQPVTATAGRQIQFSFRVKF